MVACPSMNKNGRTPKKKKERKMVACPSMNKSGRTQKKKRRKMVASPCMNKSRQTKKKKKKEEEDGCMSVHEQKWTDTPKKE